MLFSTPKMKVYLESHGKDTTDNLPKKNKKNTIYGKTTMPRTT
jgi:hypothetical protein